MASQIGAIPPTPTSTMKAVEKQVGKLSINHSPSVSYGLSKERAIFQTSDGGWIGSLRKETPNRMEIAFRSLAAGQSNIECCLHIDPKLTSIPTLNRGEEYVQKAILLGKSMYNASLDNFDINVKEIPSNGYLIPKQIIELENHQDLLQAKVFRIVEMKFKAQDIIGENVNNKVKITDSASASSAAAFRKLFKGEAGEVTITAILRWSAANNSILNNLRNTFRKDIHEVDGFIRSFVSEQRFQNSRPDFNGLKYQMTYPSLPLMATHFGYALVQLHEYEIAPLVELRQANEGHEVRILTYDDPTSKSCRWLGVFWINATQRRRLDPKPTDTFSFRFHPPGKQRSDIFHATVAAPRLGVGKGQEIVAWIRRPRSVVLPSKLLQRNVPPSNEHKAIQILDDSHNAARIAFGKAKPIKIEEINMQSSETTFDREMKALASLASGRVLIKDPSKTAAPGKQILVDIPGDKDKILSGKLVSSKKDINMIEGAEVFLQHHKSADMLNIVSYLEACPNGLGVIWGPAGTGKTRALCEIARAKVCAAIKMPQAGSKSDLIAARILMTAPSNAACDVIVRTLRRTMSGNKTIGMKEDLGNVVIIRAHTLSTEDNFVRKCATLVKKKNFAQLSKLETEKLYQVGLLQGGNEELNSRNKSTKLPSSNSQPKKPSSPSPALSQSNGNLKSRSAELGDFEKEPGTNPADLKMLWEICVAVEFSTSSKTFMNNENFILVKDSLGHLLLETAGLLSSKNKYTNPLKWGHFRRYFTLFLEDALDEDGENDYETSRDELRAYCIGIIDVLVSTHINSASAVYRKRFAAKDVYADEASLASFPEMVTVIESYPAANYIIAGDPKQLAPTVKGLEDLTAKGKPCVALLKRSILDILLERHYPHVLLTTQHRATSGLMDIANNMFYDGYLQDASDASDEKKFPHKAKIIAFMREKFPAHRDQASKDVSYLHLDVDSEECESRGSTSISNLENASVVFNLVEMIIEYIPELSFSDITIVVPYKDQIKLYEHSRKEAITSFPKEPLALCEANRDKWNALDFFTTDRYQGGSNKIIIVDMVRSEKAGFLKDAGRMCVSLTRAEEALFVVGRSLTAQGRPIGGQLTEVYKEFEKRGRSRKNIPSSMLEHPAVK